MLGGGCIWSICSLFHSGFGPSQASISTQHLGRAAARLPAVPRRSPWLPTATHTAAPAALPHPLRRSAKEEGTMPDKADQRGVGCRLHIPAHLHRAAGPGCCTPCCQRPTGHTHHVPSQHQLLFAVHVSRAAMLPVCWGLTDGGGRRRRRPGGMLHGWRQLRPQAHLHMPR